MGLLQEFKTFAVKGNALDLAVGIVVGAAFNKIVTSLVNDIIMPPIGWMIKGVPFRDLELTIKPARLDEAGKALDPAVAIYYGAFINTVIEFLIIAFTVFLVVKFMNRLILRRETAEKKP